MNFQSKDLILEEIDHKMETHEKAPFCKSPSLNIQNHREKGLFYEIIRKYYLVTKFIRKLKTSLRSFKARKHEIISQINDKSYFFDEKRPFFNRKIMNYLRNYSFYQEITKLLYPDNRFLIYFEGFMGFLTLSYFIIIPLNIGFDFNVFDWLVASFFNEFSGFLIKKLVFLMFLIDLLMNFKTIYLEKGEFILETREIVANYLKKRFLSDFLSLIYIFLDIFKLKVPFSLNFIIGSLYFLRFQNLSRILSKIEAFFLIKMGFLKLLLVFLLWIHVFSCFWFYIGRISENEASWILSDKISSGSPESLYLSSIYYVFMVLMNLGSSDIKPQNEKERIFTIFLVFFSYFCLALKLFNIIELLRDFSEKDSKELKKIDLLMRKEGVGYLTRLKIMSYYRNSGLLIEEKPDFFKTLSQELKTEYLEQSRGAFLSKIPIFQRNFNEITRKKLLFSLEKRSFNPGEMVFSEESQDLFFLLEGSVFLFYKNSLFGCLKAQETLNSKAFFSGKPLNFQAKTKGKVVVLVLRKEEFLRIIQETEEDYCIYCQIKDSINLYGNYEDLAQKNDFYSQNHEFLPFFEKKPDFLNKKCNFKAENTQKRSVFLRKGRKYANFLNIFNIQRSVLRLFSKFPNSFELFSEEKADSSNSLPSAMMIIKKASSFQSIDMPIEKDPFKIESEKPNNSITSLEMKALNLEKMKQMPSFMNCESSTQNQEFEFNEDEKNREKWFEESKNQMKNEENDSNLDSPISDSGQKEELIIDGLKEFKAYFPHNNVSEVLKKKG